MTDVDALAALRSGIVFDAAILDFNLAGEDASAIAHAIEAIELPYLIATGYAFSIELLCRSPTALIT